MKLIPLSQDRVAIVDDEDFKWLSKWNWCYWRNKEKRTGYARRCVGAYPNCQVVSMHTAILKHHRLREIEIETNYKNDHEIDHENGCGCDNRKLNLRVGTSNQNKRNKKRYRNNTSGVIGVNWSRWQQKWRAYISPPGIKKPKLLGWFVHKKDAIKARYQAEIKYFGEYRHDPTNLCPLWKTGQCSDCAKRAQELGLF